MKQATYPVFAILVFFQLYGMIYSQPVVQRITLEGPYATAVSDPECENEEADGTNQNFGAVQSPVIRTALLGPEANVLQVQVMGINGAIRTPILLLEVGPSEEIGSSVLVPFVTIISIGGSGPDQIGQNLLRTRRDESEDIEDETEEENNDDEDDDNW